MLYIDIDGTLKPRGKNLFPTHDASWGRGGYKTFSTLNEMYNINKNFLIEGCLSYCCETGKEYRWLDNQWKEIEPKIQTVQLEPRIIEKTTETVKEPQIIEKVVEEKVEHEYEPLPKFQGIDVTDNSIKLVRKDGTTAFEICLDENEDANIIFYNKEGKAVGVFNPCIFE